MTANQKKTGIVKEFIGSLTSEDLLNVGFMTPIELQLRSYRNDKQMPQGSLPQGIMIAAKESIQQNKYILKKIEEISPTCSSLDELKMNSQNNYISLLKKKDGIELAICICMYSEQKKMLKRTLAGVAENMNNLILSGVNPDDIAIFVLMDGIQKIDPSLFGYFEELQRMSRIYVDEGDDLFLYQTEPTEPFEDDDDFEEDEVPTLNKYLFRPQDLQNRVQRKFMNVRSKYQQVNRIREKITNIKKDKSQDSNLKMIVSRLIESQKTAMQTFDEEGKSDPINISQEAVLRSLAQSQEQCRQYITTREHLSYLASYRVPTKYFSAKCAQTQQKHQDDEDRSSYRSSVYSTYSQKSQRMKSTNLMDKSKGNIRSNRITTNYMNLFFNIKYKNSGKLASHNWFFNGFCNELKPKYAILLDVGLKPASEAVFKMYKYLKQNEHVGGVCGYMSLKIQKQQDQDIQHIQSIDCCTDLLLNFVDIQRCQQLQYHFSHLIDKSFESVFKFIHVLPGAFSGYSMDALKPVDSQDVLLKQYFKSIQQKLSTNKVVPSTFTAGQCVMRIMLPKFIWTSFKDIDPDSEQQILYSENIYLAEDRILCMGIHKNDKDIIFMPDAFAQVDPMKNVHGLMGQRKRWINGSMFSFQKVIKQLDRHQKVMGKCEIGLKFQILYLVFMNILVFFAPSVLLFTIALTMQSLRIQYLSDFMDVSGNSIGGVIYRTISNIVLFFYIMVLLSIVFFSIHLTNRNKKFVYYIYLFSTAFGIITIFTFIIFFIDIVRGFSGGTNALTNEYSQKLNEAMGNTVSAETLILAMMLLIVSFVGLYIFPIITYALLFRKVKFICEVILGAFSFLFYTTSYLNLLNIYALCRIDDISWGTKGIESGGSNRDTKIQQTWKVVKLLDVAKFVIWNIIISSIFISFNQYLLLKFFLTFALLALFCAVLLIKVVFSIIYMIKYKCVLLLNPINVIPSEQITLPQLTLSTLNTVSHLESSIRKQIQQSLNMANLKTLQKIVKARPTTQSYQQSFVAGMMENVKLQPNMVNFRSSRGMYDQVDATASLELLLLRQRLNDQNKNDKYQDPKEKEKRMKQFEAYRVSLNRNSFRNSIGKF